MGPRFLWCSRPNPTRLWRTSCAVDPTWMRVPQGAPLRRAPRRAGTASQEPAGAVVVDPPRREIRSRRRSRPDWTAFLLVDRDVQHLRWRRSGGSPWSARIGPRTGGHDGGRTADDTWRRSGRWPWFWVGAVRGLEKEGGLGLVPRRQRLVAPVDERSTELVPSGWTLFGVPRAEQFDPVWTRFRMVADGEGLVWLLGPWQLIRLDPRTGDATAWDAADDVQFASTKMRLAPAAGPGCG